MSSIIIRFAYLYDSNVELGSMIATKYPLTCMLHIECIVSACAIISIKQ
jgi:hypothetical protein